MYFGLQAFNDAYPAPTAAQRATLQGAMGAIDAADQSFIAAVNTGLAAGVSDFTDAITQLDQAIQAFQQLLGAFQNPGLDLSKANDVRSQKILPYVKK